MRLSRTFLFGEQKFSEIPIKMFTIRPSIAFILRGMIVVMIYNDCVIDQLLSSLDAWKLYKLVQVTGMNPF